MRSVTGPQRRRLAVVFAVLGNALPIAIATAGGWSTHPAAFFVGAAGSCVVPLLVTGLPSRLWRVQRVAAFAGLPLLTAMQAGSGGAGSRYAILMMMAMFWFGLEGSDRELALMFVLLVACAFLPMFLIGAPDYPVSLSSAATLVVVSGAVAAAMRTAAREAARLAALLRREATIDPLTGVLNRRGWEQEAGRELERAGRAGRPVVAVVFDLDGFKRLNDTHGHDAGDEMLRLTSKRIRAALRAGDIVARLGGDEFVAMLPDATAESAVGAVTRLQAEATPDLRLSAGAALHDAGETLGQLVRRADAALYAAKAAGGHRCELAPNGPRRVPVAA